MGPSAAFAQVTIQTGYSGSAGIPTSISGAIDTYSVTISDEKQVPIVKIELLIPTGFQLVSVLGGSGWVATGLQNAAIWNGSAILPGKTETFRTLLRNPSLGLGFSSVETLLLAATYGDGSVGGWRIAVEIIQPTTILRVQVSFLGLAGVSLVLGLAVVSQFMPQFKRATNPKHL